MKFDHCEFWKLLLCGFEEIKGNMQNFAIAYKEWGQSYEAMKPGRPSPLNYKVLILYIYILVPKTKGCGTNRLPILVQRSTHDWGLSLVVHMPTG